MNSCSVQRISKYKYCICPLTFLSLVFSTIVLKAQVVPFQAMYFQNRYLADPAMAGLERGLSLNIGYRQQQSSYPGAPKTAAFTADYGITDKMGLGININNDETGLLRQTKAVATYAYHLPLGSQQQKLNFGLSFGINDGYIDESGVDADLGDVQVAYYNQLKPYFDGDLGIAYTSNSLSIEAVAPNLRRVIYKNSDLRANSDVTEYMGTVSYKMPINTNFTFEPKIAYRYQKAGFGNLFDLGANLAYTDYGLSFCGIYHTDRSVGMGFNFEEKSFGFNVAYNVQTGQVRDYSVGAFEVGVKIKLFQH